MKAMEQIPNRLQKPLAFQKCNIMKIYFAGSIRGGREDAALYFEIIEYLKDFGEVLTEHVGDAGLLAAGDDGASDSYIHDRDVEWLQSAEVLVAEVTTVSMGVGYEIGRAVESGKNVLCLFRPGAGKHLSAMIAGCPALTLVYYNNMEEGKSAIATFFAEKGKSELLFNDV